MNNLFQNKNSLFPQKVHIEGKTYAVNADFRNILRIFAVLADKQVNQYRRLEKLIQWFFAEQNSISEMPENISIQEIYRAFSDFVSPPESVYQEDDGDDDGISGKQFDYDFDADEIYAGFLSEYNIDLADTEFLHWYKFKILIRSLSGESAFKKKIELRFMDLSGYKGKHLSDMAKAKKSVQLPESPQEYTDEELAEINEFEQMFDKC